MVVSKNISGSYRSRAGFWRSLKNLLKLRKSRNVSVSADKSLTIQPLDISSLKSSCHQITVNEFCDCLIEGNFSCLGDGTEEQIRAAWLKIQTEYSAMLGDNSYKGTLTILRDMHLLRAKIFVVRNCIYVMEDNYIPVFGKILEGYGIKYKWEFGTEAYWKNLSLAISRTNGWSLELSQKEKEWDGIKDTDKKLSREYFEEQLIVISEAQGYNLTMDITLSQYVLYLKRLRTKSKKNARR